MVNLPESKYDEQGRPIKKNLTTGNFIFIIVFIVIFFLIIAMYDAYNNPFGYGMSNEGIFNLIMILGILLGIALFRNKIIDSLNKIEKQSQENMKNNNINFDFQTWHTNQNNKDDEKNIEEFMRQNSDLKDK